jgi:transmembrane 9 superfamily protein 2/4
MAILFWFVYIAIILYVIVVGEISVTQTYLQLCHEDYHWWWRSYALGASPCLFFLALALIHLLVGVRAATTTSVLIYIVQAVIASSIVAMISGCCAFFASYLFVFTIYRKGKIQ